MSIVMKKVQSLNNDSLHPDDDLISNGLNSISTIHLIVELETHYNIIFKDTELKMDNFSTVRRVCQLVLNKMKELPTKANQSEC